MTKETESQESQQEEQDHEWHARNEYINVRVVDECTSEVSVLCVCCAKL